MEPKLDELDVTTVQRIECYWCGTVDEMEDVTVEESLKFFNASGWIYKCFGDTIGLWCGECDPDDDG